jgi:hypothetical protein
VWMVVFMLCARGAKECDDAVKDADQGLEM